MVVLVGLGVDQNGVRDSGRFGEGQIGRQEFGRGLVGSLWMVGERRGFEQMDVRVDQRCGGAPSATPAADRANSSRRVIMGLILSRRWFWK